MPMTIDDPIGALALTDADGVPVDLAALATGTALVLFFFPKADTPGCTVEARDFAALADAFAATRTRVAGISRDTPQKLARFRDKHDLAPLILLSDEDGAACAAFGTWVEKQNYGRRYMGIERATFLFDAAGRLKAEWRKVRVKDHAATVLDAVRTIGAAA